MSNTITGFNVFTEKTLIRSAHVNSNFSNLINLAPLWQKYTVAYTALSTATASVAYTLFTATADDIISGVYIKHSTAFAGGAISAVKAKIGTSTDDIKYLTEFDVLQATTTTAYSLNSILDKESGNVSILLTLSLTGGNLSDLSAGQVDVYIQKCNIP